MRSLPTISRGVELDRQRTTYQSRLAVQREMHKVSR